MRVDQYVELIEEVNRRGGPTISEYEELKVITNTINNLPDKTIEDDMKLFEALSPAYDLNSMVGFSFLKPHGYAGDHELIDRIYSPRRYHKKAQTESGDPPLPPALERHNAHRPAPSWR